MPCSTRAPIRKPCFDFESAEPIVKILKTEREKHIIRGRNLICSFRLIKFDCLIIIIDSNNIILKETCEI